MTTEKGSDELLAEIGDMGSVDYDVKRDAERNAEEDERLEALELPVVDDERGEDHPDPDESPPADQAHDEYNPTPPSQ